MSRRWPLFDLRLYIEDVELRIPDLELLEELADVAAEGIHLPGDMPFAVPWSDDTPDARARSTMQVAHWTSWGQLSLVEWGLHFVVIRGGTVVGTQFLGAKEFTVVREVATGSWLGLAHQGKGTGTLMRTAVLALAFDGLGALTASTGAWEDNPSSQGVTEKLGYQPNGIQWAKRREERKLQRKYLMTVEDWQSQPRARVRIEGLESCLPYLIAAE